VTNQTGNADKTIMLPGLREKRASCSSARRGTLRQAARSALAQLPCSGGTPFCAFLAAGSLDPMTVDLQPPRSEAPASDATHSPDEQSAIAYVRALQRDGRLLLRLTIQALAQLSGVSVATIIRAEKVDGPPSMTLANADALRRALEAAGAVLLPDGAVRLRKQGDAE